MSSWRLGVRLALASDRVRLLVTAGAVSLTVAFLLGALGALPARQAKLDRLDARSAEFAAVPAAVPARGVRLETATGWYRGRPLTVRRVVVDGPGPLAPGLTAYPRAGEVLASPDLAADLRSSRAGELATRVPGRLVGTVGSAGLSGPHELFAYVGVTSLPHQPSPVSRFDRRQDRVAAPVELRVAAWLGAVGLLLPVLVLVATATRLSASSRDRRLAALRLVGATPSQARGIAAMEGLVAGIAGVAGGLVVFWLLRGPACALLPFPEGVYAQDLRPTLPAFAAVVVGVPLLAVGSAVVALRRVVLSPLGVRRSARVRGAGWVRLVPVAVGLAMLVVLRLEQPQWQLGSQPGTCFLLGGGGLTLVGLAVAAPALTRLAGRLLGRSSGVGSGLAAGRLETDPSASARVVTGMVLVVFTGAWLLAFLPVLQSSRAGGDEQLLRALPTGTVLTSYSQEPVDLASVRAVPGVQGLAALGTATLAPDRYDPEGTEPGAQGRQVVVGSCRDLAAAVHADLGCTGALAYRLPTPFGQPLAAGRSYPSVDGNGRVGRGVALPKDLPELRLPSVVLDAVVSGELLLDPSLLPSAFGSRLVVRTDGRDATTERLRSALPFDLAMSAASLQEQVRTSASVYLGYLRATRIGLVLALVVGAASLAVTTADAVHERRRSLATLVAFGTPVRVLRRAVLLQTAAPMLVNALAALGAAAVASACYLGCTEDAWTLPWGGWALAALAAVVAVLLATAATLPMVSAVGRPEALRAE